MRLRNIAAMSTLAVGLLAAGAASATPVLTIDGISIPNGLSPGGFLKSTESSFETQVLVPGDVLRGITQVTAIQPNGSGTFTYNGYGFGGVFLVAVFDNFTVASAPSSIPGDIFFTGGTLKYYVSTTDHFSSAGTPGNATDINNDILLAQTGTLWLSLTPAAIDAAGHTLQITISSGSLTNVSSANAKAFLDVVGGDAAWAFNTNGIPNAFSPTGFDDAFYTGTAAQNTAPTGAFKIVGSNDLFANAVPEPVSISLFGGGLAALGAFARRRKAKKA